jgi:hypothetical protein
MSAPFDARTIEKVDRPELKGFRGAISLVPPDVLHKEMQGAYNISKRGTFSENFKTHTNMGMMTAHLMVGEMVKPESIDVIRKNLMKSDKVVFVALHGLDVDVHDLQNPKTTDRSKNYLAYALMLNLSENLNQEFYPWLKPTNAVRRTGLKGAEMFAFQSTYSVDKDQKNALQGKRVILVDDHIHGGGSAYAAAEVALKDLGARSVAGVVSLTQSAVTQNTENVVWSFLPNAETATKLAAKTNMAIDSGRFKETLGFGIDRLTQKEATVMISMINQQREETGRRHANIDLVTDTITSIRTTWADTHHGKPKQQMQFEKKNSGLIYNPT